MSLRIEIFDDRKIVHVWLTHTERDDPSVMESLKPLFQAYRPQKYTVAVYLSGDADLCQQTSDLLCYNRKRIAEMEVLREETSLRTGVAT